VFSSCFLDDDGLLCEITSSYHRLLELFNHRFMNIHTNAQHREGSSGVEEVVTIATLQKILSPNTAQAKLMSIQSPDAVVWGQNFGDDVGRREWHERKMMSKFTRAKRQLDLMGLSGTVLHC
jgi:hypothetical protein